jgi:tRNA-2-methylthio-N6-dimethylallyladenosine synthase
VHFPVPEDMVADDLIGKIVDVRVDMARTWYLAGSVEGPAR